MIDHASRGKYTPDCLRWETHDIPLVGEGEVLVRTLLLSIDPTTRNWLLLDPSKQMIPIGVGDVMIGGAVGVVQESRHPGFQAGDLVSGVWGWSEYAIADPTHLEAHRDADDVPDELFLSLFSHIGRAAAIGLLEIGRMSPDDVVVVSGAAGATGSVAVQIAAARGNRVIAIAGGADKCAYAASIGATATIDYTTESIEARLKELAPEGVDVYFDNVGGPTLDAVLATMAVDCRIVVCGAMSQYNLEDPSQAYGVRNLPLMLWMQARMEGFVVPRFAERYPEFDAVLVDLWRRGKLNPRAHVIEGIEHAPASVDLNLQGSNRGKLMVRVSQR